jgi:hypothetical protein
MYLMGINPLKMEKARLISKAEIEIQQYKLKPTRIKQSESPA